MNIVTFMQSVNKLKTLKRAGWVEKEIPFPESVADHSYSVTVMAMLLAPARGLDQLKCLKMALVHDLPESLTGDTITMRNGIEVGNLEDKLSADGAAARNLFSMENGSEYVALLQEYQNGETSEAKLVRQLDALEMAITALGYEAETGTDLAEFYVSAARHIEDEDLVSLLSEVKALRAK